MTLPIAGGEPKQMTSAPEGVSTYEWAPDGRTIAYLSVQSMSEEEERRRKDQTFVIQVDRQNRPPRLWLQALDGGAPRAITPLDHFVDGVSWMPDGRSLVYSAAPFSGFMAPYETSLYAIPREGGSPRVLVEREGIDNAPQISPDGRYVAFISTGGRRLLKAARGLSVISLDGASVGRAADADGRHRHVGRGVHVGAGQQVGPVHVHRRHVRDGGADVRIAPRARLARFGADRAADDRTLGQLFAERQPRRPPIRVSIGRARHDRRRPPARPDRRGQAAEAH